MNRATSEIRCKSQAILLTLSAFVLTQSGCVSIYWNKPINFQVLDAETSTPIEGAVIEVQYDGAMLMGGDFETWAAVNKPKNRTVKTDARGQATLPVANFNWKEWTIVADGFINRAYGAFPYGKCLGRNRAHEDMIRVETHPNPTYVIQLFRGPRPTYEVVIPKNFVGPIVVDVKQMTEDEIRALNGQRQFRYAPNGNGYVELKTISLGDSERGIPKFKIVYSDGSTPPGEHGKSADGDVVLRKIEWDLAVVGDKEDYNQLHRIIYDYKDGNSRSISLNSERFNLLKKWAKQDAVDLNARLAQLHSEIEYESKTD